jgi:peptide chain release factor 2
VRISPFDSAARRHTSFASVYVWPELPEDVDIEIDGSRIDTFDRADRRVACQRHRLGGAAHAHSDRMVVSSRTSDQHRNRDSAMKVLARLFDLKMKEQQAKLKQIGGVKREIAFGSQIRAMSTHISWSRITGPRAVLRRQSHPRRRLDQLIKEFLDEGKRHAG